ncbi:MAG: exopolysaccharide biosynthesis protein [Rhodobacter sp.]|nr:exopolysaccharide biosynthesis protein [Rhodobacter sp.]
MPDSSKQSSSRNGDGPDHGDAEDLHDDTTPEGVAGRLRRFGRKPQPQRKRLSELLDEIGSDETRTRISVSDLLVAMEGRATGALLLLFALPNVLPTPPGTSGILGLPLVYLSAQMMLGRLPWLPPLIANRSMSRDDFAQTISRATPLLARAEKLLKPRLSFLVKDRAQNVIGAVCLLLAVVLMLPIPLGNMLPAVAISLISLGVLERDGAWVLGGFAVAAASMIVVAGVIYAMAKAAVFLLLNAF